MWSKLDTFETLTQLQYLPMRYIGGCSKTFAFCLYPVRWDSKKSWKRQNGKLAWWESYCIFRGELIGVAIFALQMTSDEKLDNCMQVNQI